MPGPTGAFDAIKDVFGLGQSKPSEVAPGAAEIAHLQAAGYSAADVAKYQRDTSLTLMHAGFTAQQIEDHWGIQQPNSPEIAAHVANNIQRSGVTQADGPMAAFEAGWGTSTSGIVATIAHGGDPNKPFQVAPGKGLLNNIAQAAGQTIGDIPTDILGFFGGAAAGSAVGGGIGVVGGAAIPVAGETGISEAAVGGAGSLLGGAIGGAAGMGAASQATREVLLDAYNRNQIHSFSDFLHVVGASSIRTLKAAAATAPFGLAGPIGAKLGEAGAGKVVATVGGVGGATALGVSTGAALNGRMPDAKDFVTAAATMLVMHGAIKAGAIAKGVFKPSPATLHIQNNLEEIYRRNGTTPWDAVNQARNDPGLRQEILQQDVNGNSVAPRMHNNAPAEPPPIKHGEGEPNFTTMKNVTPKSAPLVNTFEDLSTALEGSRDDQVSPAGAIGKHQIMLGTARQYGFGEGMSQSELAQWLHDPNNNAEVFHKIATDLHARFHGDMNAMLIAYNAGPGRAGKYMTVGPGTELEAIPDKTARGGIRYESVPSNRDESWLPMETQKYLANGRRRSGGATEEASGSSSEGAGGTLQALAVFPSDKNHAALDEGSGGGGGKEPPEPPTDEGEDGYWKKAPYGDAVDEIMANIGEPPKPPSLLNPDRLMEQYVSELTPARNIDTALVREGKLSRNMDVGQEDMFRQTYASDTRTGAFVRFGVLKIENNEIRVMEDSPSVMKAADEVRAAGGNMREWTAYMLSKRTLDKDSQGIKTGFTLGAAERAATAPEAAKYEKPTQTFNGVMNGGLDYARDSGLFSDAQIEAMKRDNPAYISMRRIMGDDESFGGGKGRGFNARDPLRQMEGSDRQIIDPIHATIDNLRVIVAMSDRNRAIGSIIGQVEAGKLPDLGLEKLEYNPKFTVSAKEGDPFKPYGLDGDEAKETYEPLLAERGSKGLSPNQFIFFRDGKPEVWSAKDPALVRLMKAAVTPGEANIVGRAFDKIAALDRMGVVVDPSFPTRITLRHQITAFVADPLHPPPFLTWMRGVMPVFTQNDMFQEWLANGGAGTALTDMDVNWLQRDMEFTFEDQGIYNRMWNRMKHPLESYQWMAERMDAAARVGYYQRALAKDISPLKAATMSRKAYLDYAERASLNAVNSLARKIPFLRPKILGIKQFAEAFASSAPGGKIALSAAATLGVTVSAVTLPTILLYAANYFADKSLPDEEKYSSIPRWIRDTHYITPPIAGARIQFPYPPVVGIAFGGMVNRFLDYMVKSDPHAADDAFHSLIADYDPRGLMPTAIKTPLEATSNYNYMTGHPIVPSSVEAADGYMQYTNATTEPAKALSRWLGPPGLNLADFSPIQTEHWIDGWTGPVGIGVLRAVNGRMTDYQPPHQMADTPVVGTFFVRNPEMHSQQIEDFYTDLKSMEAAHADWALAMKHGDEGEIATAARGPFYGLRIVGKIATALHVQAAAVAAVNKDTTLRPEEKSQAVDQILNSMIQLSVMGSGITATIQGKEPAQAFKDLDKSGAMATATR